jgi:fumarate hydratase subunit alpha
MVELKEQVVEALGQAIKLAATRVRKDVRKLIAAAAEKETSVIARKQLNLILQNFDQGVKEQLPYCQDTGTIHVYATLGGNFPLRAELPSAIEAGIVNATKNVPLRPNSADPLSEKKYADNTGPGLPDLMVQLVPGDALDLDVMLKGGGAENMSRLFMLEPIGARERIPRIVQDLVIDAGGKPCPPVIIGVGIGGSASMCMSLAKKALLRELGTPHADAKTNAMEKSILDAVNGTGIGTMGLGGDTTCLAVHIETCARHPASYPIGVAMQCYAHRHARVHLDSNGKWTIPEEFYS